MRNLVRDLGGFHSVTEKKLWRTVAHELGFAAHASRFRQNYYKILFPFDLFLAGDTAIKTISTKKRAFDRDEGSTDRSQKRQRMPFFFHLAADHPAIPPPPSPTLEPVYSPTTAKKAVGPSRTHSKPSSRPTTPGSVARPRGRAPKDKAWDANQGVWIDAPESADFGLDGAIRGSDGVASPIPFDSEHSNAAEASHVVASTILAAAAAPPSEEAAVGSLLLAPAAASSGQAAAPVAQSTAVADVPMEAAAHEAVAHPTAPPLLDISAVVEESTAMEVTKANTETTERASLPTITPLPSSTPFPPVAADVTIKTEMVTTDNDQPVVHVFPSTSIHTPPYTLPAAVVAGVPAALNAAAAEVPTPIQTPTPVVAAQTPAAVNLSPVDATSTSMETTEPTTPLESTSDIPTPSAVLSLAAATPVAVATAVVNAQIKMEMETDEPTPEALLQPALGANVASVRVPLSQESEESPSTPPTNGDVTPDAMSDVPTDESNPASPREKSLRSPRLSQKAASRLLEQDEGLQIALAISASIITAGYTSTAVFKSPPNPVVGGDGGGAGAAADEGGAAVAEVSQYDKFLDELFCERCGSLSDEESMLICDECDQGYHMFCLVPPLKKIPKGDWRCMVRVFIQIFALKDAIGSHACSLEALTCV
jgi:hypothetical protein